MVCTVKEVVIVYQDNRQVNIIINTAKDILTVYTKNPHRAGKEEKEMKSNLFLLVALALITLHVYLSERRYRKK